MSGMAHIVRRLAVAAAALAALCSTPALAWGDYGHRATAAIAMANMSPRAQTAVRALLRAERGLGTPRCRVRSLEDASTWPDCLRGESWRWAYSFSWHYQTQNICKPYDPKANCSGGACITAQIERNRRILADRSLPAVQRLEALAFLVHFIGDIHNPLHSGDNADLGGNTIDAQYGEAPGRNLHAIWDGPLAERAISAAMPPLIRRYSAAERAELNGGGAADWGRESWELSGQFIYPRVFGGAPCTLGKSPEAIVWSNEDIAAGIPVLQRRVQQAGLRIARMLDETLGG